MTRLATSDPDRLPDAAREALDRARKASASRTDRYKRLEWLREHSTRNGARSCMHALAQGVNITANSSGVVGIRGARRCASPWSCSCCSPVIAERRATEIDQAASAHLASGGSLLFVTATLAHKFGDDLDDLLTMLQSSWSATFRWGRAGRPSWYGGQVRTVEITYGRNGWHPHVHSLVFVPPGHDAQAAVRAHGVRWARAVERRGGATDVTSSASPGWDVRPVHDAGDLAGYLTKVEGGWSAGLELTRSDLKRKGTTPFMLLEEAAGGDSRARSLFLVYERATAGRRRVVASPGLLAMVDDEEAALGDAPEAPNVTVYVPAREWHRLLHTRRAGTLLDRVRALAMGEVHEWPYPPGWLLVHHPTSTLAA